MILWHGTSEKYLEQILAEGLRPGGMAGESNWDQTGSYVHRLPGVVYLTDSLAWLFAIHTAATLGIEQGDPTIVECSVGTEHLLPDQDYLCQSLQMAVGISAAATEAIDLETLRASRHGWRASLDAMGMVVHDGPVGPRQIRRIAVMKKALWSGLDGVHKMYVPGLGQHAGVADDARRINGACTGVRRGSGPVMVNRTPTGNIVRGSFERPQGSLRVLTLSGGRVTNDRVI